MTQVILIQQSKSHLKPNCKTVMSNTVFFLPTSKENCAWFCSLQVISMDSFTISLSPPSFSRIPSTSENKQNKHTHNIPITPMFIIVYYTGLVSFKEPLFSAGICLHKSFYRMMETNHWSGGFVAGIFHSLYAAAVELVCGRGRCSQTAVQPDTHCRPLSACSDA